MLLVWDCNGWEDTETQLDGYLVCGWDKKVLFWGDFKGRGRWCIFVKLRYLRTEGFL